jgi:serine O-acetyltransferase
MLGASMRVVREIVGDTRSIARSFVGDRMDAKEVVATMSHDGSLVLAMSRVAGVARRHGIPLVGSFVRRFQTTVFGIEIARDVRLGEGVVFLHTVGVVIGGNAIIGDRVMFLGGNTIGSVDTKSGYPCIGNDVIIGAGARILGPVTIGDGAAIGANAVVLCDVPAGAVALGIPAVVRQRKDRATSQPISP